MNTLDRPNIDTFFQVVEDTLVFTGNNLKVYVPSKYKDREMLIIEDYVKMLAIFSMKINDIHEYGLLLPNIIKSAPSTVSRTNIDNIDYYVLEYFNGDKFLLSTTVLKESFIAPLMYQEFISLGNLPAFLTYDTTALLFDTAEKMCDINLRTPHTVFEMMYAHLFRDPDNLYKKYRFTDKSKKPAFIGTSDVSFGPESTTSKIIGAYFADGINSALVNASDQQYRLEDLLRQ